MSKTAPLDNTLREQGLACARAIADWLCLTQERNADNHAAAGSYPFSVSAGGAESPANNWNLAFAIMGLLSAFDQWREPRYEAAALRMGRYLKTLQIFEPFLAAHRGAIREYTPQTPWCYTRDAASAAWGFLALYRHTRNPEWLERARLWGEWFLRCGLDEEGYPLWGVQFEPYFREPGPQMCNHIQGSFQGGCLNVLWQLGQATGVPAWTGAPLRRIADIFTQHVQQESGFFVSIERATKKPPASDPQLGLHRGNDDLGTLGLLCAYRATGERRYLTAVRRFLDAVFARQRADGHFEDSCAATAVILNAAFEAQGLVDGAAATPAAVRRAIQGLCARQSDGSTNPRMRGGLDEEGHGTVCARSSCYALIVLLKWCGTNRGFLSVEAPEGPGKGNGSAESQ
jgi:hypothetical protein